MFASLLAHPYMENTPRGFFKPVWQWIVMESAHEVTQFVLCKHSLVS